jgi:hypothetical protein
MLESILAEIDAEIARLQSVKVLLSSVETAVVKHKRGRPAAKTATPAPAKREKRRTMSAEARERIRQAQIKRWAAVKKSAKPNVNAAVAPLPIAQKKATKGAA